MNRKEFINNVSTLGAGTVLLGNPLLLPNRGPSATTRYLKATPVDNQKALINPSMGWTLHYYDNSIKNYGSKLAPSDTVDEYPGLSTVYFRLPWAFLEPKEGQYRWEIIDGPAQRWIDQGKQIALRITAAETGVRYASPKWVKEAGAKGYYWGKDRKNGSLWEPDFGDSVFLDKLKQFIAVMAARYNGNHNVAFVDIGSYGTWGEGHTVHSTHINYPFSVLKKHVDIYTSHFTKTQVNINDDFVGPTKPGIHFPITDYALSKGVTLRDDSILVQNYGMPMPSWNQKTKPKPWYHAKLAQRFWPEMPVIIETQHYGPSVRDGAWNNQTFLQSVEAYHASYVSIHWWPHEFLKKERDIIHKINMRMGYRIQLREAMWPAKVRPGNSFQIKTSWANTGVAPCYPGGYPCFTIKSNQGGIVSSFVDPNFSVESLNTASRGDAPVTKITSKLNLAPNYAVGKNRQVSINVKPGKFNLYISVGKKDGTPVLELPYNNNDGHNRYKLGIIRIGSKKG